MTHAEFLSVFLRSRNLELPDGRPLYEYKISNGRYDALKVLLTDRWDESVECHACFVLYAVEFLRAETAEGHLKWDYIFESIQKQTLNRPHKTRKIVETGLRFWNRDVFIGQNREFLETLRFESGLPNSSLNDNSNLSSLIKSAFQFAESYSLSEEDLISFIEGKIERCPIPLVLRQQNFYKLVSKLCFKFLEFKKQFDLANNPNPTEFLKQQLPNWREEMPLKIEGERMIGFFDGIIFEISRSRKSEPLAMIFSTILKEIDGVFSITTIANIPNGNYSHESFGLSEEDFNSLPGYFSLYLELDGKAEFLTGFNKLNNGRISARGNQKIPFSENIHEKEWKLIFASENREQRVESELSKYLKLNLNDPLVFVKSENEDWNYRGSAPLKLKDSRCLVVMNDMQFEFQNQIQKVGSTTNGLTVYQIDSDVSIMEYESRSIFWIKLSQENENIKVLDFTQTNFPDSGSFDFLKENEHLSLGLPRVYLLNKFLGFKELFSGTIEVLNQYQNWEVTKPNVIGRRKFRFKDRLGNILGVKTLNVLPVDFKIYLNPKTKTVEISSSSDFNIFVTRNGVEAEITSVGNSIQLLIDSTSDDFTNDSINFGVRFNSFGIINLKVPNPNFSEVFVNPHGKVVERVSFSLSKIYGGRIVNSNYSGVGQRRSYKLKLDDMHDHQASALEIKKMIWVEAFSTHRQPLYQWMQQINQLFSLTTNTRAKVRISSETPHHYIEVSKYDCDLIFDATTRLLTVSSLGTNQDLLLSAFRLDRIFDPQNLVNFKMVEGVCSVFDFLTSEGTWFIFASSASEITVIPKVIIQGEKKTSLDKNPIESLHEACHLDYDQRISRFKEFFDYQYLNFEHPVWKELYDLFKATEHLPISALDVWKGLVKSPKGMLTFFFSHYSDSSLIRKVTEELGFVWHFVPVFRWQEVFSTWSESMLNSDVNTALIEVFKSGKLSKIKNELGLFSLVELLVQQFQPINIQLLTVLIKSDINGENGRLGVRTRHPEGVHWASYASEFIQEKFNQLPDELKRIIPAGLNNWQKPVVYLPVILAYQSINSWFIQIKELSPETLLGIKLNMDFDRTYFDDVYSKVQGFCFNNYFNNPQ